MGDILGMLGATIPARAQRAHTCEFGMSVLKDHRGRGIGTQLLKALESWARRKGLRRIECAAFSNNTTGIRLYRRLGYRIEGRRRQAVEVGDALLRGKQLLPAQRTVLIPSVLITRESAADTEGWDR